ncbi:pisatin demethylase, partial [Paraphoma chrysanthemicola]
MLTSSLLHAPAWLGFAVLAAAIVLHFLWNRYGSGLNTIAGPFLASGSDYWRLFLVWGRRPELTHQRLHQEYGDLVRIGPKSVLVSDWTAVKKIYGLNAGYVKSGFYPVQQNISKGTPLRSLFNTTDEKFHSKLRRSVANAYSMSNLVQFEPLVDSTIAAFVRQLEARFVDKPGDEGVVDFGTWLHYYAFDVIGELTFSKRLGFIDDAKDVDGIIETLENMLDYFAVVGQNPWLDRLLWKNPLLLWCNDHGITDTTSPVAVFAKAHMAARLEKKNRSDTQAGNVPSNLRRDFLDRFLDANKKDPVFISDERVLALTVANIFAGADTTAITLRSVFYFLLKNPECLRRLLEELTTADLGPSSQIVSWEIAHNLPYLTAVIQESLRMHPAVGLPLERVVPAGGLEVNGVFIPPGTIVGATARAIHSKSSIFGSRPEIFAPERWLDASESKRIEMNNALFSFGMGARTCIGKNISLLEMYKLVPTLLRQYEITFARQDNDWMLHNAWFVKQKNFFVRLARRNHLV